MGIESTRQHGLLGPAEIRDLASALGVRPTKVLGQNFVHDAGTVRRIVRDAQVTDRDVVVEVGPGLGSLTLALLETGACVTAVEIDPVLAAALPQTVAALMPERAHHFAVARLDALAVSGPEDLAVPKAASTPGTMAPTALVANLPYNVAVPVVLTVLEALPSVQRILVMVQSEVADRLAAGPGSRVYGIPSAKAAWYADVTRGAKVSRSVFWPVPNVDSALVELNRHESLSDIPREEVFAVIDAAFAQRRKTLRAALAAWAGSPSRAEEILAQAGIDPRERGEKLGIRGFIAIAEAARSVRA